MANRKPSFFESMLIEEMESAPKIDPGLFAMMESSVKDDPDVVKASKELSNRRDAIIDEVCRKDAEYSRLSDARRTAIETAYAKKTRNPSSRLDSLYNGVGR